MNSDESPPGPRDPVSFAIAGARELRILRPREVGRRTTLSVAQINRLRRENRFPPGESPLLLLLVRSQIGGEIQ